MKRPLATAALVVIIVATAIYLLGTSAGPPQNTTSERASGTVLMSLGQTPRLLGPGIAMNYTLTIIPGAGANGMANLSSEEPSGVTVALNPSNVALAGNDIAVDVSIRASDSVAPGEYGIGFKVAWGTGSSNLTFQFRIVPHLVLLLGAYTHAGGLYPESIDTHVGETVVWLNVDPGGDEFGGQRQIRIVEQNVTSPTLTLYSSWSYTFNQAGTYTIEDPLNSPNVPEGSVVVS